MPATPTPRRSHTLLHGLPVLAALGVPLLLAEALGAAPRQALTAGQVLQSFDGPSGEDLAAFRRDERALWGRNSALSATSHFPGDGGPGGDFDWTIPSNSTFVLDTTFGVITNDSQTNTQNVIGGYVNVRNLTVLGTLEITGPNGCRIAATGNVIVEGQIRAAGADSRGVVTFNTGGPDQGMAGGPGGGRGGAASSLNTQSTPIGDTGFGAFNAPGLGGTGGETGFNGTGSTDLRRGAGGGGGRFGPDVRIAATGCPDQVRIGLDVEQGGPGAPLANGAIGGLGVRPQPGRPGAGPFVDGDPANDFFGRMITAGGATIVGELTQPWAGAGGGGGGDSCWTPTFPTTPYTLTSDEIGGGGGGGGGSLMIHALGDVVLGANARIDVTGGNGGGGENTAGINRVGGAGGGGSGGHLVIQAGRTIDLRACVSPGIAGQPAAPLMAWGGQGGEGMNGAGGSGPNGVTTPPGFDSVNLVAPFDPACVPLPPNVNVIGSGGDGGPGVIQLHVNDLANILAPTVPSSTISGVVRPPPVGAVNVDDPSTWDRLVPPFGPDSSSRSQWTSLAGVGGTLDLYFGGTAADGRVQTNGNGQNARVSLTDLIVSENLASGATLPRVDVDGRTLLVDQVSFFNDVWWNEPATLVDGAIEMGPPNATLRFDIESASVVGGTVRLTVAGAGTPLAGFAVGTPVGVRPRYFRVRTNGVRDSLPNSASIRVTFQGAPDDGSGAPNTAFASAWTANVNALESLPGLAFVRFQVDFDLAADGSELNAGSPRPSLEFLRIPFAR